MGATRTQIYLTAEQRHRIDELTKVEGTTLADVIRKAVDAYLERGEVDATASLAATFGADPDAVHPDRGEWQRG